MIKQALLKQEKVGNPLEVVSLEGRRGDNVEVNLERQVILTTQNQDESGFEAHGAYDPREKRCKYTFPFGFYDGRDIFWRG